MPDKTLNTLLYIDDDASLRALVEIALTTLGSYSVRSCASGADALSILQHFVPDMILLDMTMPDMDGLETLNRIRTLETGKNIPIVFMTGESNPELLDTLRQAGVLDIISKPFNPMQLATQVQALWNQYVK